MGLTNLAAASNVINPMTEEIKDKYKIPYNSNFGVRVNDNGARM